MDLFRDIKKKAANVKFAVKVAATTAKGVFNPNLKIPSKKYPSANATANVRKRYDRIRFLREIIYNDTLPNNDKHPAYDELEELEKLQKEYSIHYPMDASRERLAEIERLKEILYNENITLNSIRHSSFLYIEKLQKLEEEYIKEKAKTTLGGMLKKSRKKSRRKFKKSFKRK